MATTNLLGGLALDTTLASVLAKLSGDPATQTTLAAVLAKLSSDPATQTTLAAVLAKLPSSPALDASLQSILTKLTADPSTATLQNSLLTALGTGAATGIAKLEDAAAASGDRGVPALFLRGATTPVANTDAAGDYILPMADAEGKTVHLVGAVPENTFQFSIQPTTAATTSLVAAAAAGIRNYITELEISNAAAVAQNVTLLDGATVVARYALPATIGAGIMVSRRIAFRGTAATAWSVTTSGAGAINFNVAGYRGV